RAIDATAADLPRLFRHIEHLVRVATLGPVADPARGEEMMAGPYRIEDWGNTWLNPDKERVLARVPAIALPDIVGYWPQTTRAVRGPTGVCQAHPGSARLYSRLPRAANGARYKRQNDVCAVDCQRHRSPRAL